MQLPTAFQGSSHFGDDVLPDTPIAQRLLSKEQSFLSADRAQVMVFDGAAHLAQRFLGSAGRARCDAGGIQEPRRSQDKSSIKRRQRPLQITAENSYVDNDVGAGLIRTIPRNLRLRTRSEASTGSAGEPRSVKSELRGIACGE